MFSKRYLLGVAVLLLWCGRAAAQQDEFCNAVGAIVRDAPNKFRNIRGKLKEANANATHWDCGIKVPGTIKSRFVASMGLFYEGGFFQTRDKEELRAAYDKQKAVLNTCLTTLGYTMTQHDNFYPGLANYKKLVFMQEVKEDTVMVKPPAHITMEATYSKDLGLYTVVMYIFEH